MNWPTPTTPAAAAACTMRAIDLFAGAGGFTEGARRAGVDVVWAANHWPAAVDLHSLRHPNTTHSCQDLRQADFRDVPDHDLLLASPACQGHSPAGAGARKRWGLRFNPHDDCRSTAFAVISAAEAKMPEWLLVENVPQMRHWKLYGHWRAMLETLGYELEEFLLDAADFGTPQNRHRLFIAGRLGAAPRLADALPQPSRKPRDTWRALSEIVDLDDEGSGWKPVASKSAQVRERVDRSRARHGEVFLTQHVRDHMGRSIDKPLPTITTADQMALVRGDEMRPLTVRENLLGQGFPANYLDGLTLSRKDAIKLIGNAVAVDVARTLCAQIKEVAS